MCQIPAVDTGSAPRPPSLLVMLLIGVVSIGAFALVAMGIASDDPDVRGGSIFGLVAVVAVVVIVFAVRRSRARRRERERVLDAGTMHRARIVKVRTEGASEFRTRVGFELEVEPEAGEPYRAFVSESVPNLVIPRIQPDHMIDVWVDPVDPQRVVIDPELLEG